MTLRTNGAGVAICSCGGELVIACSHGCAEPDAEQTYHGRPTTKCVKHLAQVRKYEANRRAREVKIPATGTR